MDAALQRRRREEHLAAMRQGLVLSMAGTCEAPLEAAAAPGPALALVLQLRLQRQP
jgi:hypothetical protein